MRHCETSQISDQETFLPLFGSLIHYVQTMVAFTFVCREQSGSWSATRYSEEEGDLEADADSTYELQGKLYQLALQNSSGGGVRTSFSLISPSSAVYQVSSQLPLVVSLRNLAACKCATRLQTRNEL